MNETVAAPTYTYDPTMICDGGKNQMRFELGDTEVSGGTRTCALSDQEYDAIIKKYVNWKLAYVMCLKAISMKYSHQVDFSISGMSYQLSQKYKRWDAMYVKESKKINASSICNLNRNVTNCNSEDGGHYFRFGMHDNKGHENE